MAEGEKRDQISATQTLTHKLNQSINQLVFHIKSNRQHALQRMITDVCTRRPSSSCRLLKEGTDSESAKGALLPAIGMGSRIYLLQHRI